jgi:hypothetical protein
MFNNEEHEPTINLGYIEQDDKCHFVIITKLNCLISHKYYSHKKLICAICNTIFSNREALLNHEKVYHSDKELPIINFPSPDKAFINFDITRERDLKKTVWYPFVFYADFEASTKVVDSKAVRVPNSYIIFSPDLSQLVNEELISNSFIKSSSSDDPYVLMRQFINDLRTLHKSHIFRMSANARVPQLTPEEEEKYNNAKVCENCKKEFGTIYCHWGRFQSVLKTPVNSPAASSRRSRYRSLSRTAI